MRKFIDELSADERAQDIVEYALLIAVVAFAAVAIFATSTSNMGAIWQRDAAALNAANALSQP